MTSTAAIVGATTCAAVPGLAYRDQIFTARKENPLSPEVQLKEYQKRKQREEDRVVAKAKAKTDLKEKKRKTQAFAALFRLKLHT